MHFWLRLPGSGRQSNEQFFWFKIFLEIRHLSEILDPLISFLAYVTQNYCSNKNLGKNKSRRR